MVNHNKRVIGSYESELEAIQAVEKLKADGYRAEDISVISKNRDDIETVNEETGTKTGKGLAAGAATGGVLGGLTGLLVGIGALAIPGIGPLVAAGPIAAALTGAAVGAGAGGLAGALIGMGIPEDEARQYEDEVKTGRILVLVDPGTHDSSKTDHDAGMLTKGYPVEGIGLEDREDTARKNLKSGQKNDATDPFSTGKLDKTRQAFGDNPDSHRLFTDDNIDVNRPLDERIVTAPRSNDEGFKAEADTGEKIFSDEEPVTSDYPKDAENRR
ncbi:hypothetical protein CU633_11280 [Bacillus sp. V3-13]|nr:hypothetical protein CU633_11280 [Bacillus sp. V3-13]